MKSLRSIQTQIRRPLPFDGKNTLQRKACCLATVVSLLFLSACDFEFPLGEPSIDMDQDILGVWASLERDEDETRPGLYLVVSAWDQQQVAIHAFEIDNTGSIMGRPVFLRAYWIEIEEHRYLQIEWPEGPDDRQYGLAKVSVEGDTLSYATLSRDQVGTDHPSAEALREAFLSADRATLFQEVQRYRRVRFR